MQYDELSVISQVQQLGFRSVSAFCDYHPGIGYTKLSKMMTGIPPIAVIKAHCLDMSAKGEVLHFIKNSFVRAVREKFPNGLLENGRTWSNIRVFSGWSAEMKGTCNLSKYDKSIDVFIEMLLDGAQVGWRPESETDEMIVKAFSMAKFDRIGG